MIPKGQERKHLLVFGYGLAVILVFFAVRSGLKHGFGAVPIVLSGAAFILTLISAIDVYRLKPVYVVWMKVAHLIGGVVSTIIYSVLFYGIFGLVGVVLRLMGKDLLDERLNSDKPSYWVLRKKMDFKQENYQQQF